MNIRIIPESDVVPTHPIQKTTQSVSLIARVLFSVSGAAKRKTRRRKLYFRPRGMKKGSHHKSALVWSGLVCQNVKLRIL
jgi:hypothetical protein